VQNTEQTQRYTRLNLVKKYLEGETKEERKTRKALEKVQKSVEDVQILPQKSVSNKYYVLCLKHGTKYSSKYVNTLYSMVKRHCTLDVEMVCLTDDITGIDPAVKTLKLPEYLQGWWCKPYMFSNELPMHGTILYIDLDVVISDNIDKLFTYQSDKWCTIRDFTRKMRPTWEKYNSSVIKFNSGQLNKYWEAFRDDRKAIERKYHGDQDWLWNVTSGTEPAVLYPDNWIMSWKWEIRKNKDLNYKQPKGTRTLRTIENVVPPKDCAICVFHGDPNPEHCNDPWVIENWR
jgi:hypothetical protein